MSGVNNPPVLDELLQTLPRQMGELLENPFVTDGGDPPTGWSKTGNAVLDASNGYKSRRSLRLNPTNGTGEWWSDRVWVKGSVLLLLMCRVKGTGSANVELRVRYWDSMSAFISEDGVPVDQVYSDWTAIRKFSEAPSNAFEADVRWVVLASDTVDISGDAFSLRQVGG